MSQNQQPENAFANASPPPSPYAAAVAGKPAGGMAVTALVLAIIGILTVIFGVGLLLTIIALVLGIIALATSGRKGRSIGVALAATILSGMTLLAAPVVVAILVPVIGSSLGEARKAACLSNMKMFGSALREYERQNAVRPQRPMDLVKAGLMPESGFKCGGDTTWTLGRSSYFYLAPDARKFDQYRGHALAACDLQDHHSGGRCVLTVHGNVTFVPENAFRTMLQQPDNAAFAAALAAVEASGAKNIPLK
ncbi:MAG: DUF4190 domain-containing protein [Planctomycetaceae bacterium]|nr:DUF4190 domain-containing protein [Planctomycetaceae bacterium]